MKKIEIYLGSALWPTPITTSHAGARFLPSLIFGEYVVDKIEGEQPQYVLYGLLNFSAN